MIVSLALYFSPIILAITEGIKKLFPGQISGIYTMLIATLIGVLIGFIFPQVGIGVGLFSALIAISGATLADRVGQAMKSQVVVKTESPTIIADKVTYEDTEVPNLPLERNRIEDLSDYPQPEQVSYTPVIPPYTESKELG